MVDRDYDIVLRLTKITRIILIPTIIIGIIFAKPDNVIDAMIVGGVVGLGIGLLMCNYLFPSKNAR